MCSNLPCLAHDAKPPHGTTYHFCIHSIYPKSVYILRSHARSAKAWHHAEKFGTFPGRWSLLTLEFCRDVFWKKNMQNFPNISILKLDLEGKVVPLAACQLPNPRLQRHAWRDLPPVQSMKLWRRALMRFHWLSKKLETWRMIIWKTLNVIFMPCFGSMALPYPYRLVLWSVGYSICTTSRWLHGSDIYSMISPICFWVDSRLVIRKLLSWWNLSGNHFVLPMETIGCFLSMEPTYRNVCHTTCTWMKALVFANQQSWYLTYKLCGGQKPKMSLRNALHHSLDEQIPIWSATCWKVNVTINVGHRFWPDFWLQPSQRGGTAKKTVLYTTSSWRQSLKTVWSWP